MALSNNIASYEDIRLHLDRALGAETGIRLRCNSHGQAVHMRQRLYKLRALEREQSLELYEPGDSRRATSAYDLLKIEVEDEHVLILQIAPIVVEDL